MNRRLKPLVQRIRAMSSTGRLIVGVLLLIGGMLWILPVFGLWMIPLGLLVLSFDFPWARRWYLNIAVWLRKMRDRRKQKKKQKELNGDPD